MTDEDLLHQLKAASENHCLFYEQVSGEWIDGAERKKNEKETYHRYEWGFWSAPYNRIAETTVAV